MSLAERLPPEPEPTDGRRARRERNRSAVIDAYLELVAAGNLSPTIDELAEHTGLSFRSIYRYFDDMSQLVAEVAERGFELAQPFFRIDEPGTGTLDDRIERFIDSRLELHRRTAAVTRAARARAAREPVVLETFQKIRSQLGRQVTAQFEPEIGHLSHDERRARVAGIYVAFLFDSLELLFDMYRDEPERIRSILRRHLRLHLADPAS